MRRILILAIAFLLPALALSVWAGSLMLSPDSENEARPVATPTVSVVARADPVSPSATLPRPTTIPPSSEPTPVPVEPTATEPGVPPTSAPISTDTPPPPEPSSTPFPPPQVVADRVGGPVSVPNQHSGPRWVTLQVGHWRSENYPSELAHLLDRTGAFAGGVSEVDINLDVSQRAAEFLSQRGFMVDILDAIVPVSYTTDLFLAIHADGNTSSSWRGFKAVSPWVSVPAAEQFVGIFYEEYGKATGLPADPFTSVAMADYYAFNGVTYKHAINPAVPAALIELGFVSSPLDRQVLTQQSDRLAWGIANSVDRWFRSGAVGPTPSPYPSFTPTRTPTSTPTDTPTSTPTSTDTPTGTPTPTPTPTKVFVTTTVVTGLTKATPTGSPTPSPTSTPSPSSTATPIPTSTPIPTPTPLTGTITTDGRWLPPLSANGRNLPPPGSQAEPVLLSEAADEPYVGADGRERRQVWRQYYDPQLGRGVWRKGPLLLLRP